MAAQAVEKTSTVQTVKTEGEAIRVIQDLEKRLDLLQYQVDGWCLWPLLRFDVVMEMVRLPLVSRERFTRFQQMIIALRDIPALLNLSPRKYLVKSYSSARSFVGNGRLKDVFFDDLFAANEDVFRLEGVNHKGSFLKRNLAKNPATLTSLPIELLAGVLALLPGIAPDFSKIAEQMSSALNDNLEVTGFSKKRLLRKARFFYWGKKLYLKLLKRLKTEKVLTADPGEYFVAAAAKELGIPVMEFQHGLVSRDYNSFYAWTGYAKKYKEIMPISDVICLFGDHWKNDLLQTGFWDAELRSTGRILLDSFRSKKPEADKQTCNILLTSQGLEREKLIALLDEFAILAATEKEFSYHLIIKMHPVYDPDKSVFESSFAHIKNILVLEAAEKPSTFELLANADLHCSISSTCHYDALGLGVPTVILGLQTYEDVLPLHRDGYALLARDAKELFEITRDWKTYKVTDEIREYFYRSGALENARKEIGLQ
jgi:hypothetical protein